MTAEQGRASAEQGRVSAEKSRVSAEQARVSKHSTNQKASTEQTARAKAAADKLSEFEVQVESLPPSADPTAKVTQTSTKTTVNKGFMWLACLILPIAGFSSRSCRMYDFLLCRTHSGRR